MVAHEKAENMDGSHILTMMGYRTILSRVAVFP
jgi:hypothetical protein